MNKEKDEVKFDKEFLFKYGKLFKTSCLYKFYKNLENTNQDISNKYNESISIFFYISDENDNVKYAYEQVYNPIDEKEKDYFINRIKNLYEREYKYTTKHDKKKIISFIFYSATYIFIYMR